MIGNFNVLRRSQLQNNEGLSPSVEAGVNPSFNSISYKPESWEFAPEERYHSRRIDQDLESYAQNHSAYSRESLEIEQLKKTIKGYQRREETAESTINALKNDLSKILQEQAFASKGNRHSINELKQIDDLQRQIIDLKRGKRQMEVIVGGHQVKNKENQQRIEIIERENLLRLRENEKLKFQVQRKQNQIEYVQFELSRQQTLRQQYEGTMLRMQDKIRQTEAENSQSKQSEKNLQNELQQVRDKCTIMQRQFRVTQNNNQQIIAALKLQNQAIQQLNHKQSYKLFELDKQKGGWVVTKSEWGRLQQDTNRELQNLRIQLENMTFSHKNDIQKRLNAKQAQQLQQIQTESKRFKTLSISMQQQYRTLLQECERNWQETRNSELNHLTVEKNNLQNELANCKIQLSKVKDELQKTTEQMILQTVKLEQMREVCKTYKNDLQYYKMVKMKHEAKNEQNIKEIQLWKLEAKKLQSLIEMDQKNRKTKESIEVGQKQREEKQREIMVKKLEEALKQSQVETRMITCVTEQLRIKCNVLEDQLRANERELKTIFEIKNQLSIQKQKVTIFAQKCEILELQLRKKAVDTEQLTHREPEAKLLLSEYENKFAEVMNQLAIKSQKIIQLELEVSDRIKTGKQSHLKDKLLESQAQEIRVLNTLILAKNQQIQSQASKMFQLQTQKANLQQKYHKYKQKVLRNHEKAEEQRLLIVNTHRFNDEILGHCEQIINRGQQPPILLR